MSSWSTFEREYPYRLLEAIRVVENDEKVSSAYFTLFEDAIKFTVINYSTEYEYSEYFFPYNLSNVLADDWSLDYNLSVVEEAIAQEISNHEDKRRKKEREAITNKVKEWLGEEDFERLKKALAADEYASQKMQAIKYKSNTVYM